MTDETIHIAAARAKAIRYELARRDPSAFVEIILKDEETGQSVKQAPYHVEWQDLITNHKRIVLWSHVESGKTQQITTARVLWELGRDPGIRIVIVSATNNQASKIVRAIGQYITTSTEIPNIFPDLKQGARWTGDTLIVKRTSMAKDPSVQSIGVRGSILGARIDLLIMDDVLDYETTRTEYMRTDTMRWIETTLFGRLTRRGRVIIVGNAWHIEDAMYVLASRKGWHSAKYPVMDVKTGKSNWPERWPIERIDDERENKFGPLEYARQLMCEPRSDADTRFRPSDIERCLELGRGKSLQVALDEIPAGARVFSGVDLAISRKRGSHRTVIFTILVHPDEMREVLSIESGRWSASEILDNIESAHRRFQSVVIVENNQAQDFIVQFARDRNIVVRPFTTGRNKAHPLYGVESLAAEMAGGKWIIPSGDGVKHPEVQSWVDEMIYYDPVSHTGDRLMASWFAREGARTTRGTYRFGYAGDPVSDAEKNQAAAIWDELESLIGTDY